MIGFKFAHHRTHAFEHGDFTPKERALLQALYPHLAAAVHRVTFLARERSMRQAVAAGFAAVPEGRIILDWSLRPVFQNQSAIEACDVWSNGDASFVGRSRKPNDAPVLPIALLKAATELLNEYRDAIRRHAILHREWVHSIEHPEITGLSARIRILETLPSSEPNVLIELSRVIRSGGTLQTRPWFKLTGSERRVAELAASGQGNQQIADALGVSVHTIRAHLREVFSKLGIERRSQLAEWISRTTLFALSLAAG